MEEGEVLTLNFAIGRIPAITVLVLLFQGCMTPLVHQLRATKGIVVEGSVSYQHGDAEGPTCDNGRYCDPNFANPGGVGFNPAQLSVGYSHVFWEHVGLMAGIYFPAWNNLKDDSWASTVALWTYSTLQNDYLSVGVGPEVGWGGWAVLAGLELRPWKDEKWAPRFGFYGRLFWPYEYDHSPDFDERERTWEVGVRLRLGKVYFQYSYFRQVDGYLSWTSVPNDAYSQFIHIYSLGISFEISLFHSD